MRLKIVVGESELSGKGRSHGNKGKRRMAQGQVSKTLVVASAINVSIQGVTYCVVQKTMQGPTPRVLVSFCNSSVG